MRRGLALVLFAAAVLVATGLATVALLVLLHRPSLRVVASWQSPAGMKYQDHGPYHLTVVETDSQFPGVSPLPDPELHC